MRPLLVPLLFSAALAACSDGRAPSTQAAPAGPLARAFAASAEANGVPRDLMVAVAQHEGGLTMPRARDVDPDALVPVAGPMELRHGKLDTLARGAALIGTSELTLRRDADLALEAGGRVLAEIGARTGASTDLASWSSALEELSGLADEVHRRAYAHDVMALLARGGAFPGRDGEVLTIAPHPEIPASAWITIDTRVHTLTNAEYPGAEWFPTSCTNKCDIGRGGNTVQYVVIHDTEGGWSASVATLQNDPGKSVQYIVNTDGHVGQFVVEANTAWHAGNYWYNQRSVGIEHVGYATQPYPTPQYDASAQLVAYLTEKYNVAKDRAHIVGHDQVPNGNVMPESSPACTEAPKTCETGSDWGGINNHRDPGDWEWCVYMQKFGGTCKCDDVTAVLTCSTDKTEAFRCTKGTPELYTCPGGCTVRPSGTDDVCAGATPLGPAGAAPDAGAPDDAGAPLQSGGAVDAGADAEPVALQASISGSGGCSTAGGRGDGAIAGLGLVVASTIAARHRRRATTRA